MGTYLPPHALAFRDLYSLAEHTLRRSGYMRPKSKRAEVDWRAFSSKLGSPFFDFVRDSGCAAMLLREPPRIFHRKGGWLPVEQTPVKDAEELIIRGVCQARHNMEHGEKFIEKDGPRSDTLVIEAHWVLEQAINFVPEVKEAVAKVHRDLLARLPI